MAVELAKVCRICRYADGVCTTGFRKTHEPNVPPSWFDFQGDCTSGTGKGECAPSPGAATWGTRRRRRAPAKDSVGRARNHRRKRLHMQYPPDPLDKWIARDIQLNPGDDYMDNIVGEH